MQHEIGKRPGLAYWPISKLLQELLAPLSEAPWDDADIWALGQEALVLLDALSERRMGGELDARRVAVR